MFIRLSVKVFIGLHR